MPKSQRCLLGVFAHPDDETSCAAGTFARYAREGVAVYVVTATRGEQGTLGTNGQRVTRHDLPRVRDAELRAVLRMYGAEPPIFLGYRDYDVQQVDRDELVARITAIMHAIKPDVVLTFGPHGPSGHPDHLAVHQATVAAFHQYRQTTAAEPRLYYKALLPDAVKALGLTLEGPEVEPTLMIDISAYKALKVRALRTYKTQEDAQRLADLFERVPWAVEAFHQAYPPVPVGVQSVGFWETARTSDAAVLMPHTQQDNAEMELVRKTEPMNGTQQRELPYAWVIVALAALIFAVSSGLRSTIGLLVRPWEVEFGWERAAVSLVASCSFLVAGLTQTYAGRLADRYGPRRVFTGSLVLLGLSTAAMGVIQTLWQVYVIYSLALAAAVGGASNVTAAVAITRWIRHKVALAIGIVMAGGAVGQLGLVPIIAAFMHITGWRTVLAASGAAVLVLIVPLVVVLLYDNPPSRATSWVADTTVDEPPQLLAALVRQRNFWWLALGFGICGTTVGLISTHLIPYAEDLRIDPVTAATAFGVLGAVNVAATLAAGAISDRWGHQRLLGTIYAGRAVVLIFLPFVHDPTTLFVFAIAFGAAYFPSVPPTTALATTLFGRRSGGTVVGLVWFSHQLGSAIGSYAGGLIHDVTGSYVLFFVAEALLCLAAAAMSWAIAEVSEPPVRTELSPV